MVRRTTAALVVLAIFGCGGSVSTESPVGATPAAAQSGEEKWSPGMEAPGPWTLPPPGYGTLAQNRITIPLIQGNLQIKIVPLDEWVILMTAPDTHRRLNRYKTSRFDEIQDISIRNGERFFPHVMFVTLFTRDVQTRFELMDLVIVSQNVTYRPLGIIPISPDFGRGQLQQQVPAIALYVFSARIDLNVPMSVEYQAVRSPAWSGIKTTLDNERALVASRSGVN
jgi:hypothetical protein